VELAGCVQHLQQSLNGSVKLGGSRVYASLSAGLIPNASGYTTPAELLRDARTAVEQAASLGGGHALAFKPQMRDLAVGRMELEHDLRHAIANKEFELYYQPKVQLESGALLGFEALLRWRHPRRGLVAPLEFIPLAEETGLIVAIGDWVIEEACKQTYAWHVRYAAHSELTVGVNVSSKQLEDPGLTTRISKILDETGLPPQCLALEITESALVSDGPEVLRLLEDLRSRNIGLHIDDFGTGYSALQYLQRLPFDTLKIDKSFVDRLGATRENTEITRAIIALAHHLNMNVVSEGIETREQLNILRDFGARVGQGYLFSKPLSLEQAEELLRHGFEFDMEALLTPE
jgi:EAL domain-containing protein (putative c-di-GMP-specific phosphodiesterase class I)